VPDNIKEHLDIKPVKWIDEVLSIALETMPEPISDEEFLAGTMTGKGDADDEEQNRINTH
jgi:ATP-dependent Lon protease